MFLLVLCFAFCALTALRELHTLLCQPSSIMRKPCLFVTLLAAVLASTLPVLLAARRNSSDTNASMISSSSPSSPATPSARSSSSDALSSQRIAVIGAGFSGLTAACELAALGHNVTLIDKFSEVGGRARTFTTGNGFTFDMGPSWYWMPGIFEHIFARYNRTVSEFYNLTLLDPAYRIALPNGHTLDVPGTPEGLLDLAEQRGGAEARFKLRLFLDEARIKFDKGVYDFIWKPMVSPMELLDTELMRAGLELDMFSGFGSHLNKYVDDELLRLVLKWPVIFVGASPEDAASMYSLMTYAGHVKGTWYPDGGLAAPALALGSIARDLGVNVRLRNEVVGIKFDDYKRATHVCTKRVYADDSSASASTEESRGDAEVDGAVGAAAAAANPDCLAVDAVVAAADYHHVEQELLPPNLRSYDSDFWARQIMSPSTLLYYLGFNRSLPGLLHHTFFFETDLDSHLKHVFAPVPPGNDYSQHPTFYLSATSKTDPHTLPPDVPQDMAEAVFVLVPIHPMLNGSDTPEVRARVLDLVLDRVQARLRAGAEAIASPQPGLELRSALAYSRAYGPQDFSREAKAFRGNAFGLANTLLQSLVLKPSMVGKVPNMVYAGHLTNPGPGVPPALVSGVTSAKLLVQLLSREAAQRYDKMTAEEETAHFGDGRRSWFRSLPFRATLARLSQKCSDSVALILNNLSLARATAVLLGMAIVLRFILAPLLAAGAAVVLHVLLLPSPQRLSVRGHILRARSYLMACELIYRHGKTYFGAACLMDPRRFLDTAAMYALFRVADDFVDNDDLRARAAELDATTRRIDPARYSAGAIERRAKLEEFIAVFWNAWHAHCEAEADPEDHKLNTSSAFAASEPLLRRRKRNSTTTRSSVPAAAAAAAAVPMDISALYAKHSILPAVIETAQRAKYPRSLFERFFAAMLSDTNAETPLSAADILAHQKAGRLPADLAGRLPVFVGQVCRTSEELYAYMDGSAAVIGDFMLPVLIPQEAVKKSKLNDSSSRASSVFETRRAALPHARALGNAFQLTNFIRDVHEDTYIARQYLPTDACARHGLLGRALGESSDGSRIYVSYPLAPACEDTISGPGPYSLPPDADVYAQPGLVPLLEDMMRLADSEYASAQKGIAMLPAAVSGVIGVACQAYHAIHDKVRAGGHHIYSKRYRVPFRAKLRIAARIVPPRNIARMAMVQLLASSVHAALALGRAAHAAAVASAPSLILVLSVALGFEYLSRVGATLTYFDFHKVFTVPLTLAGWAAAYLLALASSPQQKQRQQQFRTTVFWTAVLCAVATLYTLPWDDYLVATRVWWYGPGRVRTEWLVGHTPGEEVAFFSLQTLMIGAAWLLVFGAGGERTENLLKPVPRLLPDKLSRRLVRLRRLGYIVLGCAQLAGLALLFGACGVAGTYAGLILAWSTPVVAVQWTFGAEALIDHARPCLTLISTITIVLCTADRWAIGNGIWRINPAATAPEWLAARLLGDHLPLEEAYFFLITTCMCVGGLTLANLVTAEQRRCASDAVETAKSNDGSSSSSSSSSFFEAARRVMTWGCRHADMSVRETASSAPFVGSIDMLILALTPLAAVAYQPAAVGLLCRAVAAQVCGAEVDPDMVGIEAVAVLRAARLYHMLASVAVCARHVWRLDEDIHTRALGRLVAATLFFATVPPSTALIVYALVGSASLTWARASVSLRRYLMRGALPVLGALVTIAAMGGGAQLGSLFPGSFWRFGTAVRLAYTLLYTVGMEYLARYNHAHVWHSRGLWWLHGTHHHQRPPRGSAPAFRHNNPVISPALELNDIFPVLFSIPATALLWWGAQLPSSLAKDCWAGMALGITLYGAAYFTGHDVVAHERLGTGLAMRLRNMWPYLDKCAHVHRAYHHTAKNQEGDPFGPPYGFWLGPQEVAALENDGKAYLAVPSSWAFAFKASTSLAIVATVLQISSNVELVGAL